MKTSGGAAHRASRLRKQPSAEFAPEARSGDVSLLNAKPSEAGSR